MTATVEPVTVAVENTYSCGRESEAVLQLPPPRSLGEGDLTAWWEEVVNPVTGDGHPCGAREHALYEVTVLEAPGLPELVGRTYEWEG